MTVNFPLTPSQFWNKLDLVDGDFDLMQYQKQSMTGGGDILTAKFGEPKWIGNYTLRPYYHRDSPQITALFKALLGRNGTFLAYDKRWPYPYADPSGSINAGSTILIKSKGSNNRSLALKGLQPSSVLTAGDKISVTDGSGKRALLELMETVTANGSGDTVEFEVQPFLAVWIAVNQAVTVNKALGKFRIVPGSFKPAQGRGNLSDAAGFSMVSVP